MCCYNKQQIRSNLVPYQVGGVGGGHEEIDNDVTEPAYHPDRGPGSI